jgi:hypothetical protein
MCVYDNCPYKCETKYAHRKRFAAMRKKKPDVSYDVKVDKILSTKVNWEVAKEYFKNHSCLSKYKLS